MLHLAVNYHGICREFNFLGYTFFVFPNDCIRKFFSALEALLLTFKKSFELSIVWYELAVDFDKYISVLEPQRLALRIEKLSVCNGKFRSASFLGNSHSVAFQAQRQLGADEFFDIF